MDFQKVGIFLFPLKSQFLKAGRPNVIQKIYF